MRSVAAGDAGAGFQLAVQCRKPLRQRSVRYALQHQAHCADSESVADLAQRTGIAAEDIAVRDVRAVTWPDTSMGCPQPDMMYAQVLTSGYQATVEVDGETYDLRMDTKGNGFICPPEK